ncbi:MAG TPA: hypothetical protein VMT29_06390 [Steroidobacteraceae bacterium]|nr:hypothetical protein [Steroidobacteraceae bacterium]
MHAIVMLVICVTTMSDFVATRLHGPAFLKLIPECFSVVVVLVVLAQGLRKGFGGVAPKYWLTFAAMAFVFMCGILSNSVGPGPMLAGGRFYVRAIPMFLLPAVYPFTDRQIRQQLGLLVGIGLLQLPIAAFQRWIVWSQGRFSGDNVQGTLMDSGTLSLVLISMALVLLGFFMHGKLGKARFLTLVLLLLLPTTINETKVTIIVLPVVLLVTIVMAAPPGRRLPIAGWTAALIVVFVAIFVPVYDLMEASSPYKHKTLMDFFTDSKQMENYMEAKKGTATIGTTRQVRRGDAYRVPLEYIARDPVHLAFGLGLGNASPSNLGSNFVGNYYGLFRSFVITSFSMFVLEIGLLGVALVFLLYWMVFADSVALSRCRDDFLAPLAAGWVGVVVLMAICTFYSPTHLFAPLSYLYWYFSGLVAARRWQFVQQQATEPTRAPLAGRASHRLSTPYHPAPRSAASSRES